MDIGTAKPTREEQTRAPHWMIDLVAPDDVYSVQRYVAESRAVLRRVAAAGRIAYVVHRVVRALEVIACLGAPVPAVGRDELPVLYLGLDMERTALKHVANRRIEAQLRAGLIDETALLLNMGYSPELPALQGFGYSQIVRYLAGALSLPGAIEEFETATHGYIRRQLTWFRQDGRITWLESGPGAADRAGELVERWAAMA
ncbi:MAG: hypothetical protein LC797_09755 [Chloroflexi bacterium]|nr:hypothetical protein [Chloroflexota bacterium]